MAKGKDIVIDPELEAEIKNFAKDIGLSDEEIEAGFPKIYEAAVRLRDNPVNPDNIKVIDMGIVSAEEMAHLFKPKLN